MKKLSFVLSLFSSLIGLSQNIGIGTTTPSSNALLELSSNTKGLLLPRLNNVAMSSLGFTGPDGLLIYNSDQNGLFIRRNGQFVRLSDTSRPFVLPYNNNATSSSYLFQLQNFGTGGVFNGLTSGSLAAVRGEGFGSGNAIEGNAGSGNGAYFTSSSGNALVTNNGFVGLGTITPAYQMDVNGRSRIRYNANTAGIWYNKVDNTEGAFVGMVNDSTFGFFGNAPVGSWKVGIDVKNGLMGIGNLNPVAPLTFANTIGDKIGLYTSSPTSQYGLGIQGSLMQLYSSDVTSDIAMGYGSSNSFTENFRFKGNGGMHIGKYSTWSSVADTRKLNWGDGDYVYIAEDNADDQMNLRAGRFTFNVGNVGIGISDAVFPLDVSGRMRLRTNGANTAGIWFNKPDNTQGTFIGQYDATNFGIWGPGSSGSWKFLFDGSDGTMRIGTTLKATGYLLNVGGKIIAEELRVSLQGSWPDYVFNDDYKRLTIPQLESYLRENKHLPNMPAAHDIETNGQSVGELQRKMVEKIEELNLYIIDLNKKMEGQAKEIAELKKGPVSQ